MRGFCKCLCIGSALLGILSFIIGFVGAIVFAEKGECSYCAYMSGSGCAMIYAECYFPTWDVIFPIADSDLDQCDINGTLPPKNISGFCRKGKVRGDHGHHKHSQALEEARKTPVGTVKQCWYDPKKTSRVQWNIPDETASKIVMIVGFVVGIACLGYVLFVLAKPPPKRDYYV